MLKKEVVVDQWWMMVENSADKVDQVFLDTETNIKMSEAPNVSFQRVEVSPSFLGSISSTRRTFIRVRDSHLPGYEMFIGIRKYGIHLDLVWYLTSKPNIFMRVLNLVLSYFKKNNIVLSLNLFAEHDLKVYATVVHHCFLAAVERVTKGTGQEIERKSKGFLGIS